MKRILLFFIMSFAFVCAYAQAKVKGVVKDAKTNQAISKATISAKNKVLAIANDNGEFEISTTANHITISCVGYYSVTIPVNETVTVVLQRQENELYEVEITATSNPNKALLYQPASISKLTLTDLKRGTGLFLDDAINSNVPGVTMNRRSVAAGQQFNIRGYGNGVRGTNGINSNFDGQGYKVYLNGISITDAEGITVMDDIDFGSIGNVEVAKGPSGTLYGLAIAGVVNLSTTRPEKGKTSIGQDVMFGSYGLQRYTTTFQTATDRSSLLLNYGYQKTDGYMPHNSSKKHFLNAAGDFRISDKQTLRYYGGYSNSYDERAGELTIPQWNNNDYSGNPEYIKRNAHSEVIGFRAGLGHSYQFCNNFSNTTTVFASGVTNNASSAGGWTDKTPLNVGARSTFDAKFALSRNIALGGITGVEIQRQSAQTIGYFMKANPANPAGYFLVDTMRSNVFAVSSPTSIFTQWTLSLPEGLSLTAGVGLSMMKIELDDRFVRPGITRPMHYEKKYDGMFSPHIAVNKVFNKQVSVYASYSRGYKAPVSSYFYIPVSPTVGFINENLEPEKGDQFELGTKGSLFKDRLNFELAVFQAIFSDKMYAQPVPNSTNTATAYTYIANGGKQNDKGVELSVKYRAFQSPTGFFRSIKPFANLTYADFEYDGYKFRSGSTNTLKDYTGLAVAGVAKYVANIGIDVQATSGIYFNMYYHYKDKMPITSDGMNIASSYNLLNGKIGVRQSVNHFDMDIFFGATNITGTKYYNMVFVNQLPDAYIPAPKDANLFGGISLKYNL